MSSVPATDILSFFTPLCEAMQRQSQAVLSSLQEHTAEQSATVEKMLSVQQDLLRVTQRSLEKLSYLELRADSAGGEPADISRHLSQWLAEYDPKLSHGDPTILKLGLLSQQAAFQRALEHTKASATLPGQQAFQLALSLISESLMLQQQNDILLAQSFRKAAEFKLQQAQQHAEKLNAIGIAMGSEDSTAEGFLTSQAWLAQQQKFEMYNVSYYTEEEKKTTLQFKHTQQVLLTPCIAEILMKAPEVHKLVQHCDGLFSVWIQYWQTEATKQRNLQSRLTVEVELGEPEKVTMYNLAELQEKIAKKANGSHEIQAQGSQA